MLKDVFILLFVICFDHEHERPQEGQGGQHPGISKLIMCSLTI